MYTEYVDNGRVKRFMMQSNPANIAELFGREVAQLCCNTSHK